MQTTCFEASTGVRAIIDEWPIEKRLKNSSCYFGYDPDSDEILQIIAQNETPTPAYVESGYLFKVSFDQTGEKFDIVLIS